MRVEFIVEGRPPKKHGEKSMWARNDESPLVVLLREKALEARSKAGMSDCFSSPVAIEITLYVPSSMIEAIGDLDNFITGVCDSLQPADPKALPYLHKVFRELGREGIDPRHPILIENDAKVHSITARKIATSEGEKTRYKVSIEEIPQAHHRAQ